MLNNQLILQSMDQEIPRLKLVCSDFYIFIRYIGTSFVSFWLNKLRPFVLVLSMTLIHYHVHFSLYLALALQSCR